MLHTFKLPLQLSQERSAFLKRVVAVYMLKLFTERCHSARSQIAEAEAGIRVAESKLVQARGGEQQAHAELQTAQTGPQQVTAMKAQQPTSVPSRLR